jgi:RNA polymerase sigma-70 factor (ECF subfamily)
MSTEPLAALFDRLRAGDLGAAEQVLLAHEAELRVIVRRQLSRRLRAKFDSIDVVQSVWARVLRAFRDRGCQLVSTAHLRHFLVRVARNCLTDRLRHYRPALACERPLTEAVSAGRAAPDEAQANDLWERLLALCPAEHHELLRLKRQGLPVPVIAARTGLHEGSVRRILRQLAGKVALAPGE